MGKLGPKLQLSFLNSIQICRPKHISSLVTNPLPPRTQAHDILFPSFPSHTTPLALGPKSHHHFPSSISRKQDHKEPKLKAKLGNGEEERQRTRRFKRLGSKDTEVENEMVDVVMKRSVDPCQDFKKSMLEMIVGKHMFEPKELEHLLMTFLSLNSTTHHRAILKAFTQIWKELFSAGSSN